MSLFGSSNRGGLAGVMAGQTGSHWKFFLFEGVILMVLGVAAIFAPVIAGLAITLFLGWLFIIAGVTGLISTFGTRHRAGFRWSSLSAVLAIVVGALILYDPGRSLVTLTYILVAYFIIDGILIIMFAFDHRRELYGKWEWMMVNGVVDLILAGIIIAGFPGTLAWALGLLIGIDMIFGGASLVAVAFDGQKRGSLR
jgi:uncharacterized membrane protein HdeD (DUF308 family)